MEADVEADVEADEEADEKADAIPDVEADVEEVHRNKRCTQLGDSCGDQTNCCGEDTNPGHCGKSVLCPFSRCCTVKRVGLF